MIYNNTLNRNKPVINSTYPVSAYHKATPIYVHRQRAANRRMISQWRNLVFIGGGQMGGGQTFSWGGQEDGIAMKGAQSKVKWRGQWGCP